MKKEIREARDKLLRESVTLRKLARENPGQIGFDIRDKQEETYKKWCFYDNIIKADDKIKLRDK